METFERERREAFREKLGLSNDVILSENNGKNGEIDDNFDEKIDKNSDKISKNSDKNSDKISDSIEKNSDKISNFIDKSDDILIEKMMKMLKITSMDFTLFFVQLEKVSVDKA